MDFWHFILKGHSIDKILVAYPYSSAYDTFWMCAVGWAINLGCINATRAAIFKTIEIWLNGIWSMYIKTKTTYIKTFWFWAFNCLNESDYEWIYVQCPSKLFGFDLLIVGMNLDYLQCFCVGLCCTANCWFRILDMKFGVEMVHDIFVGTN